MTETKTRFSSREIREIAASRNLPGRVSLLSVNQFGKQTEVWEIKHREEPWILKINYSPDARTIQERTKRLCQLLKPRLSPSNILLPSPDVFAVNARTSPNKCWCSLTKKLEGKELEDIHETLPDAERISVYETLGRATARISAIKFSGFGQLDSKLELSLPCTWQDYLNQRVQESAKIWREHNYRPDLLRDSIQKIGRLSFAGGIPCCIIDDFNRSSVLLKKTGKRYRVSAILDLDEAFSGHPEYGLSRALAYLTSKTNPTRPDYGKEYKALIRGHEKQAGRLPQGFYNRHLNNLLLFNFMWVAQDLALGLQAEEDAKALKHLL